MKAPLLLDTCAALWITADEPIAEPAREALFDALETDNPVYVSPIMAWEIGLLVSRGRMNLFTSPEKWFDRLLSAYSTRLAPLEPAVLMASSFLPDPPSRDPADRILIATARHYGYRLITRDRPLLAYAERGHFLALAC